MLLQNIVKNLEYMISSIGMPNITGVCRIWTGSLMLSTAPRTDCMLFRVLPIEKLPCELESALDHVVLAQDLSLLLL